MEFLFIGGFIMAGHIFHEDNGLVVCEYTDENERIYVMSVPLTDFDNSELAKNEALQLAITASEGVK